MAAAHWPLPLLEDMHADILARLACAGAAPLHRQLPFRVQALESHHLPLREKLALVTGVDRLW
jgi:hypothetical protein